MSDKVYEEVIDWDFDNFDQHDDGSWSLYDVPSKYKLAHIIGWPAPGKTVDMYLRRRPIADTSLFDPIPNPND